jgi:hypothetical protein
MTILSTEVCNDLWLWPSGKNPHERRSGGHRASHVHNVPGTKLVKRFIKRAKGEAHSYRKSLQDMQQYVDVR